jgi:hypothetical protein
MSRTVRMAWDDVVKAGGIPELSVTRRTNVLVIGDINPAVLVSPRLRADFSNGDQFYAQAGQVIELPERRADRPGWNPWNGTSTRSSNPDDTATSAQLQATHWSSSPVSPTTASPARAAINARNSSLRSIRCACALRTYRGLSRSGSLSAIYLTRTSAAAAAR